MHWRQGSDQPAEVQAKTERLQGKVQKMRQRMQELQAVKAQLDAILIVNSPRPIPTHEP